MPLNAQKNKVDGWVAARLPAFRAKQEEWRAAKGEYFQGLITHVARPSNAADTAPDRLESHPSDRTATWNEFLNFGVPPITLPASMPAALVFNVYESPNGGWGWELVTEFEYGGMIYRKVWNTGPETGRTTDWTEIDPNAGP